MTEWFRTSVLVNSRLFSIQKRRPAGSRHCFRTVKDTFRPETRFMKSMSFKQTRYPASLTPTMTPSAWV